MTETWLVEGWQFRKLWMAEQYADFLAAVGIPRPAVDLIRVMDVSGTEGTGRTGCDRHGGHAPGPSRPPAAQEPPPAVIPIRGERRPTLQRSNHA